jgi:uncharacterized membrane protein
VKTRRCAIVVLAAVAVFLATAVASAQLTLDWNDNAPDETGFNIERCAGVGCTNFTALATVATDVKTFVDSTVAQGVTYCYRVNAAKGTLISAYSNTACKAAPLLPPPAPTNLRITLLRPAPSEVEAPSPVPWLIRRTGIPDVEVTTLPGGPTG